MGGIEPSKEEEFFQVLNALESLEEILKSIKNKVKIEVFPSKDANGVPPLVYKIDGAPNLIKAAIFYLTGCFELDNEETKLAKKIFSFFGSETRYIVFRNLFIENNSLSAVNSLLSQLEWYIPIEKRYIAKFDSKILIEVGNLNGSNKYMILFKKGKDYFVKLISLEDVQEFLQKQVELSSHLQ